MTAKKKAAKAVKKTVSPKKAPPKKAAAKKVAAKKAAPKKAPSKKAALLDGPDPRFLPVGAAFARTPDFALMESKSSAMRGMMRNGKSFGMSSHGRFILKLTEERTAALIAEGVGKPFRPSVGRVMKGWIEITHAKADWVKLAKEAYALAASEKKKR